jgi:preprotein translocase subunit YajC
MKRNVRILIVLAMAAGLTVGAGVAMSQEMRSAPADSGEGLSEVSTPPAGEGGQGTDQAQPSATTPEGIGESQAPGEQEHTRPGWWEALRDNPFYIIIFGGLILMLFLSSRSRKKQESRRREMLAALKKGDRITTIGGIVGTVAEVREDEVTVKVDDNTRMKFARWAVRGIGDDAKTQAPEDRK